MVHGHSIIDFTQSSKIMKKPIVGIVMGSDSDLPTMQEAAEILDQFGVSYEMKITSAHRTPHFMAQYSSTAHTRGIKVIIAGAGGAAHLPGMSAAHTPLPVIGIPIRTKSLDGLDSLLSIAQMPGGVPVATVAIGGGKNAGLLAVQILGVSDKKLVKKMIGYRKRMEKESLAKNKGIRK
jgi:5-(carboxyamino)imidazole ribonucleotide mutase